VRNEKLVRDCLLFASSLCLLLVLFYWRFLSGQQSFYQADLTFYFQPFTTFIAESYRAGRLPLWNPYLYTGMSQIAVPSPGMFYPPVALFVAMPFSQALASYMLLHQLAAGVGTFLLIANLGWGRMASIVCGAAVALCGYMFALSTNYTLVASVCWLPLLLFCLRNVDRSGTSTNVLRMFATTIVMFMMVAAGRPEVSVPAALIALAYIVIACLNAYSEDRVLKPSLAGAGMRLLALTAGGILAAPIILPTRSGIAVGIDVERQLV
jgi:hypothetical protein